MAPLTPLNWIALLGLLALAWWLLAQREDSPERWLPFRPRLDALESREAPGGLQIDMVYAGAPVGSNNALIAQSPYGTIASTVSTPPPTNGSDLAIRLSLYKGLVSGAIPWHGQDTVIVLTLPPGMGAQASGPTTY